MNHRAFHFISPPGGLHRACIGGLHLILRRLFYDWRWLSFPHLPFHPSLLGVGRVPRTDLNRRCGCLIPLRAVSPLGEGFIMMEGDQVPVYVPALTIPSDFEAPLYDDT